MFALETFWPSSDGWSAARIEEQLVVTSGRLRGDHALPGRGSDRRRQALLHGRWRAAARARPAVPPQHRAEPETHEGGGSPKQALA